MAVESEGFDARRVRAAGLITVALMVLVGLALGAARAQATIGVNTLFSGGAATAAWSAAADAPGDTDGQSLKLTVPDANSYAGVEFQNESSTPSPTPPSFWFLSSVSGLAQSSPRLVIAFTDGGYIDLRPTNWTAGAWTQVDGATASWDDPGLGNCPALLAVSYQKALSCHVANGSSVSELFIVTDATFPGGFVNYIDDISYAGATVTSSNGLLLPSTTPDVTQFAAKARVALASGAGTFTASCQIEPGDHCHFNLTITATVKSGGKKQNVKIGTITGTMSPAAPTKLHINLNARGRSLLLAHQGSLPVTVSGPVTDDGSGSPFALRKNMTLKAG